VNVGGCVSFSKPDLQVVYRYIAYYIIYYTMLGY